MGGGRSSSSRNINPVKVVIINTQFVETDARNFKSVVQNLTGKDSTVPAEQPPRGFQPPAQPVYSRGMSFKDFERMLKELPSLDELNSLYTG